MKFNFSDKAESFKPNIFTILEEKRLQMVKNGKRVYNFSVGTPDFKPADHVLDAVVEAAVDTENYKYSLGDTDELKDAVIAWYKRRYGVELNYGEMTSVAGTQEGIAHIALAICNPGDTVLVPDPGYPIFSMGPYLNDAAIEYYELDENNHYAPALDRIPEETARKTKMMIVSYPLNPTCTCVDKSFYDSLVEYANKYNIIIVHDNAYSEIESDGR